MVAGVELTWHETSLWKETRALPSTLESTLGDTSGLSAVARLLGDRKVRRIVATGNGASYYAALALWLASLSGSRGPLS